MLSAPFDLQSDEQILHIQADFNCFELRAADIVSSFDLGTCVLRVHVTKPFYFKIKIKNKIHQMTSNDFNISKFIVLQLQLKVHVQ